ncbi:hypothetical protein SCG7086_AE_00260 [Chlamydiales bacterium SCGC AG-110-P3]|nr:hypothetical protein SCG7086_AE_00260 [Chlamydiales bacterium SCGC AG-110-P3]
METSQNIGNLEGSGFLHGCRSLSGKRASKETQSQERSDSDSECRSADSRIAVAGSEGLSDGGWSDSNWDAINLTPRMTDRVVTEFDRQVSSGESVESQLSLESTHARRRLSSDSAAWKVPGLVTRKFGEDWSRVHQEKYASTLRGEVVRDCQFDSSSEYSRVSNQVEGHFSDDYDSDSAEAVGMKEA